MNFCHSFWLAFAYAYNVKEDYDANYRNYHNILFKSILTVTTM